MCRTTQNFSMRHAQHDHAAELETRAPRKADGF